jgi:hypothetical protein
VTPPVQLRGIRPASFHAGNLRTQHPHIPRSARAGTCVFPPPPFTVSLIIVATATVLIGSTRTEGRQTQTVSLAGFVGLLSKG